MNSLIDSLPRCLPPTVKLLNHLAKNPFKSRCGIKIKNQVRCHCAGPAPILPRVLAGER